MLGFPTFYRHDSDELMLPSESQDPFTHNSAIYNWFLQFSENKNIFPIGTFVIYRMFFPQSFSIQRFISLLIILLNYESTRRRGMQKQSVR